MAQLRLLTNFSYTHHGKPHTLPRGSVVDAEKLGKENAARLLACKGAEVVTVDPDIHPTFEQIAAAIEADPSLIDQLKARFGGDTEPETAPEVKPTAGK